MVEPNAKGREDMVKLFEKKKIPQNKYEIFPCQIEDYYTDKKYDIVLAEGFLHYVYNQQEVINKLRELVVENGVVVVTCIDYVSSFVEIMKRLVANTLTVDIPEYYQKVEYLENLFAPQLKKLRGVSRAAKDWVQDQILNPAPVNGMELSMIQAMEYFDETFDVLGSSPHIFSDYSWYKDIWYDYKTDYKEQFGKKRLSFLLANMPEAILSLEQAEMMVMHFENIMKLEANYEKAFELENVKNIILEMNLMEQLVKENFDTEFVYVFSEIKKILSHIEKNEEVNMEDYFHFFAAFGRMQQYLSFIKKENINS